MSESVLRAVAQKLLADLQFSAAPTIVWHSGEPLTVPLLWYERAYHIIKAVAPPDTRFALQTNGIALTDRWVNFFRTNDTHVSVSIDGPQPYHDARRRTRSGRPTWQLAINGLRRLQDAGMNPSVISVLSPESIRNPDAYYAFYKLHHIDHVSFSIDEAEGAHSSSSFSGRDYKTAMTAFLVRLLELAFRDAFPLRIREIERIGSLVIQGGPCINEQVEPWSIVIVTAAGGVSTFSPESIEIIDPGYDNFIFASILRDTLSQAASSASFIRANREIKAGVESCRAKCTYFKICGGGAPVNKFTENGSFSATETLFCRLSIQCAADALAEFAKGRMETIDRVLTQPA